MKRIPNPILGAALLALALALSACERPAPGSENRLEATATLSGAVLPTLPVSPPVLPATATPTPLPAVPVGASPTPLPAATAEPLPATVAPLPEATVASTGETIHIVQAGENLYRIGLRYGFTAQELATYNNIPNVDFIQIGQEIRIPPR